MDLFSLIMAARGGRSNKQLLVHGWQPPSTGCTSGLLFPHKPQRYVLASVVTIQKELFARLFEQCGKKEKNVHSEESVDEEAGVCTMVPGAGGERKSQRCQYGVKAAILAMGMCGWD